METVDLEGRPLPRQPDRVDGPFELARPTPDEIAAINDPWGESLRARLIVLNRWRLRVPHSDPAMAARGASESSKDTWGHYEIHGDARPSVFKTWARAKAQALSTTQARPGAVLLFDLRSMPCVTSEDEMLMVTKRPHASRVWDEEDEYQFAERMADEWMKYAASVRR